MNRYLILILSLCLLTICHSMAQVNQILLLVMVGMTGRGDGSLQQVTQPKDDDPARPQARIASASGCLRLNELLASNRVGRLDDERRSSDWIEVHNPGTGTLRLGGYRLTNDPNVLDKWAFPNNRVSAGGYHIMWMSGLNRISLAPEALRTSAATIPFEMTLIEAGADWKYFLGFDNEKVLNEKKAPNGWTHCRLRRQCVCSWSGWFWIW